MWINLKSIYKKVILQQVGNIKKLYLQFGDNLNIIGNTKTPG